VTARRRKRADCKGKEEGWLQARTRERADCYQGQEIGLTAGKEEEEG
jgi:hypothetical protein